MNPLEVFQYAGTEVRMLIIDGEPWFVLTDLTRVLGLTQFRTDRLDAGVIRSHPIEDRSGRSQLTNLVSEAGMYEVVIRSDKPGAVDFRRWITSEVLPSIRRTGSYAAETPEQLMARAVIQAQEIVARRDEQIAALAPRAEAWDEIADAGTDYAVRDVAPMLNRAGIEIGPQRLFEKLHELGWIYRGEKRRWTPYARAVDAGILTVRAMPPYRDHETEELKPAAPQIRITPHGVEKLRIRLGAGVLTN
jgi:prophage antirepressor-like protein